MNAHVLLWSCNTAKEIWIKSAPSQSQPPSLWASRRGPSLQCTANELLTWTLACAGSHQISRSAEPAVLSVLCQAESWAQISVTGWADQYIQDHEAYSWVRSWQRHNKHCEDVPAWLQDQVGHDAPQATDQQPQGARERGGGGAREEGAQLPDRRPNEKKTSGGKCLFLK